MANPKGGSLASDPFIQSRVNGMIIPFSPAEAGVMHRFEGRENQLVVSGIYERGSAHPNAPRHDLRRHARATDAIVAQADEDAIAAAADSGYDDELSGELVEDQDEIAAIEAEGTELSAEELTAKVRASVQADPAAKPKRQRADTGAKAVKAATQRDTLSGIPRTEMTPQTASVAW